MNKKLLFVGVVFIVIVAAVVVLTVRQPTHPALPFSEPTLAEPAPTGIFTQPPKVTFSFAAPPSIPASLPIYTFQPASLSSVEQQAAKTAVSTGLAPTPSTLIRGGSYTKTWTRPNEAALTVTQTNEAITVTFRQIKSAKPPNPVSPEASAGQFLAAIIPPTQSLTVKIAGIADGPFDGLLVIDTPSPASFKNYFYSYVLDSYPLLTTDLGMMPISVIADSGGIIRSANIVPPPASFTAGPPLTLLTRDQILASLAAGRGTLLDTHNPQTPTQGEIPRFSSFMIEKATVVYAPRNNNLLPALYMTGAGAAAGGTVQQATIFLWLVPAVNPQP